MDHQWIHDERLSNIDVTKLEMLLTLTEKGSRLKQNELLPFLMAAAANSKSNGTSFSNTEIESILSVLKQGKSEKEIARINQLVELIQRMK